MFLFNDDSDGTNYKPIGPLGEKIAAQLEKRKKTLAKIKNGNIEKEINILSSQVSNVALGCHLDINTVIQWRCNRSTPRFIIIVGEQGSGRLTLAKEIMRMLNIKNGLIQDSIVSAGRDTIELAYNCTEPTMYIFRDADDMSLNAKNALLKVVEEPPNNAYFVMTVHNIDNMLKPGLIDQLVIYFIHHRNDLGSQIISILIYNQTGRFLIRINR